MTADHAGILVALGGLFQLGCDHFFEEGWDYMFSPDSKLIPILFWIAFLALGFFTSVAAPTKTHPTDEALVTERDGGSGRASNTVQD